LLRLSGGVPGDLLEGPVLLAQILLTNGVVHRVVGRKVIGVGTTCSKATTQRAATSQPNGHDHDYRVLHTVQAPPGSLLPRLSEMDTQLIKQPENPGLSSI
jgi:hypothetical protein